MQTLYNHLSICMFLHNQLHINLIYRLSIYLCSIKDRLHRHDYIYGN